MECLLDEAFFETLEHRQPLMAVEGQLRMELIFQLGSSFFEMMIRYLNSVGYQQHDMHQVGFIAASLG